MFPMSLERTIILLYTLSVSFITFAAASPQRIQTTIAKKSLAEDFSSISPLGKRDTPPPSNYSCDMWTYGDVDYYTAMQRVHDLPSSGQATMGPGDCYRVGCAYGVELVWCNTNNYQKNVDWADLKVRYWYTIEGCGEYSAFVRCGGASSYDDGTYVHVSTSDCLPYSFETKFCDPILMNSC